MSDDWTDYAVQSFLVLNLEALRSFKDQIFDREDEALAYGIDQANETDRPRVIFVTKIVIRPEEEK